MPSLWQFLDKRYSAAAFFGISAASMAISVANKKKSIDKVSPNNKMVIMGISIINTISFIYCIHDVYKVKRAKEDEDL